MVQYLGALTADDSRWDELPGQQRLLYQAKILLFVRYWIGAL